MQWSNADSMSVMYSKTSSVRYIAQIRRGKGGFMEEEMLIYQKYTCTRATWFP